MPAWYLARIDNRRLKALKLPWGQTGLLIPGVENNNGLPLTATLRVLPDEGKPRPQAFHLTFDRRVAGQRDATLLGRDGTGLLRVEALVDHPAVETGSLPRLALNLTYGHREADLLTPQGALIDSTLINYAVTLGGKHCRWLRCTYGCRESGWPPSTTCSQPWTEVTPRSRSSWTPGRGRPR